MADVNTFYSATPLVETREVDEAARQLKVPQINVHGAPSMMYGDIEFFNHRFGDALR